MPESISTSRHGRTWFNDKIQQVLEDPNTQKVQAHLKAIEEYWRKGQEPTDILLKELRDEGKEVILKFPAIKPIDDKKISLTEQGKEELIYSSKHLNELYDRPFDITIITPYDRTLQSFEIRQKYCKWFKNTTLIVEPDFREQMWGGMLDWPDFSIFFSQNIDDFRAYISQENSYQDFAKIGVLFYPFQNGELFVQDVRSRVASALEHHMQKNIGKTIFTITHDMTIAAKALHLAQVSNERRRIEEIRNMTKLSPGEILDYRKNEQEIFILERKIEIIGTETRVQTLAA